MPVWEPDIPGVSDVGADHFNAPATVSEARLGDDAPSKPEETPRRRLVYDLLRLGRWNEALAAVASLRALDPGDPLSLTASRQAQAYARDRTELAINQFPVVTEADLPRLFADFHRPSLR